MLKLMLKFEAEQKYNKFIFQSNLDDQRAVFLAVGGGGLAEFRPYLADFVPRSNTPGTLGRVRRIFGPKTDLRRPRVD